MAENKFVSNSKRKKGFKGKLKSAFKKAVAGTAVLAAAAGVGFYQYGTTQTEICKTDITQNVDWNDNWDEIDTYDISACGKDFKDASSLLHLKGGDNKIVEKMYNDGDGDGEYFRIKYYGGKLIGTPNILSAKHMTAAEVKDLKQKEADAKKKAEEDAKKNGGGQKGQNGSGNGSGQQTPAAGLSGDVVTYNVTVNGYVVRLTVPVEVKSQVNVNSVAPVTPASTPSGP